jgi:hypothetical protein
MHTLVIVPAIISVLFPVALTAATKSGLSPGVDLALARHVLGVRRAVASELQRTWHRGDAQEWAQIYTKIFPPYQLLIESYGKAQEVVTAHEVQGGQNAAA